MVGASTKWSQIYAWSHKNKRVINEYIKIEKKKKKEKGRNKEKNWEKDAVIYSNNMKDFILKGIVGGGAFFNMNAH